MQDMKEETRNLGLESGDGGDDVIGIKEQEEQFSAKGGRTHCGGSHEARRLSWKIAKKVDRRSTSYVSSLRSEQNSSFNFF